MKGDFSRETFDPRKHYGKVLMQQGRVQMDADWNEQQAIHQHRIETETLDVVGRTGAPVDHAGFGVSVTADDKDLILSPGRYYLDGTLYELDEPTAVPATVQNGGQIQVQSLVVDGRKFRVGELIEVFTQDLSKRKLARIVKAELPPVVVVDADITEFRNVPHTMIRRVVTYTTQPDCPEPPRTNRPAGTDIANLTLPNGVYQVYLDGWQRHITALHDPSIRETALGGPDTAARAQTVWQAKIRSVQPRDGIQADEYLAVSEIFNQVRRTDLSAGDEIEIAGKKERYQKNLKGIADILGVSCNSEPFGTGDTAASSGRMRAQAKSPQNQGDLCNIPPSAGYQRLENHLYRVEVHQGGTRATAKFKWSRDNGSVVTRIEDMKGKFVTVHDLGPDNDMGFANGQWVEIVDDWTELSGESGQLVRIKSINQAQRVIEMENLPDAVDQARNPKLRRWDQIAPQDYADGLDMSANWMPLGEEGIEIRFEEGNYKTGDYWLIPARTATGDIEWPGCGASGGGPAALPPLGIEHHYCPLALLYVLDGKILVISDCRRIFPPLTETSVFFYIGGDGQEVMPDLTHRDVACRLPEPLRVGVADIQGPVAGARVRFRAIRELDGTTGVLSSYGVQGDDVIITTGADGIAECQWSLTAGHHVQRVEANLLDVDDRPIHLPIHFSANLSEADHVAYDPGRCSTLRNKKTVQDAIDTLRSLTSLHYVSGDGQEAMPGKPLPQELKVAVVNMCKSVVGCRVRFTADGDGHVAASTTNIERAPNHLDVTVASEDGTVSCYWQPDHRPGDRHASQKLTATLEVGAHAIAHPPTQVVFTANLSIAEQVAFDPKDRERLARADNVQEAIEILCDTFDFEPGIRIERITCDKDGTPDLHNDTEISVDTLLSTGINIICDRPVDERTIIGKPTCFVTLHMPYPSYPRDAAAKEFWGDSLIGYQPVILNGSVAVKGPMIYWRLQDQMLSYNLNRILSWMKKTHNKGSLLAQLTLKGNFIFVDEDSGRRYLDGEAFGTLSEDGKRVDIVLPSGDKRRGGDFEMWFRVTPGKKIETPLRVASMEFISAPAATPLHVPPEVRSSVGVLKPPFEAQRQIRIPGEEAVNVIEITFTHPVLKETLASGIRLERIPKIRSPRPTPIPGEISAIDDTTIRFVVKDVPALPRKGQYVLTLLGNAVENAPSVRAVDGTPLDGDLSDRPGGDLVFPFAVE